MEQLIAFALFAFVASITPGPTNILVLTHSSRWGMTAALPIIIGGCTAAAMIVLLVGTGMGETLAHHERLQMGLSWVGVAWLAWLAWKVFSAPVQDIDTDPLADEPRLGMAGAALLQLVNPKTWMMALAVLTVFAGGEADRTMRIVWLSLIFFIVAVPCLMAWAWLGRGAARFCRSPVRMRRFNRAMGLLLLASAGLAFMS